MQISTYMYILHTVGGSEYKHIYDMNINYTKFDTYSSHYLITNTEKVVVGTEKALPYVPHV